MKLMHIADVHLGVVPDINHPWSSERAQAVWNTFKNLIESAKRHHVDLLLVAGDLFHRPPLKKDLKEVAWLFSSLAPAKVVLIAGNHDPVTPKGGYHGFEWPENVYFLDSPQIQSVYFPDLNTEVYGLSYHQKEITEPLYDHLKCPDDQRIHILLGHGGDPKHIPIDRRRLSKAGFHYIALGHVHKPFMIQSAGIVMAGAPEPLERTDIGKRGYCIAELTLDSRKITWHTSSTVQYTPLTLSVTPDTSQEELLSALREEITRQGSKNIYNLTLAGERDPEILFDPAQLSLCGRLAQIVDDTQPALDIERIQKEHSQDMVGEFIRLLTQPAPQPGDPPLALQTSSSLETIKKKALSYGLGALLKNRS